MADKIVKEKINKMAVIRSGGKQYLVHEGETLEVELLNIEDGQKFEFDDVLLIIDNDRIEVGTPQVSSATVRASLVSQEKGTKQIIFKYKPKKNYRVKTGHRQKYSQVKIEKIEIK